MKLSSNYKVALAASLALVLPILAGCSGTPAGDSKAGVEKGDIVVDAHKGGGGGAAAGGTNPMAKRAGAGSADGGQ